jgi:hypothetical protein
MTNRILQRAFTYTSCALVVLLVGCASTVQYPPFPDQTKRVEDPTKARVYVMHKEKYWGSGLSIDFYGPNSKVASGPSVPGRGSKRLVGQIGPDSYLCWEQSPGPFLFQTNSLDANSHYTLNLSAGNVYYLRIFAHSGWTRVSSRLAVLNEKDGEAMLKNCRPPNDYRNTK